MLNECAEATEGGVWPRPRVQSGDDRVENTVQGGEVLIVQTRAADQFPNSLDRVEFRTVRRQEMQSKVAGHLLSPVRVKAGVVIARIVGDDDNFAAARAA